MNELRKFQAVVEINRKWSAAVAYFKDDWEALKVMQFDLEKFEREFGQRCVYDNNYSLTWGTEKYGIYRSLEEMQDVSEIVESGF